MFARCFIPYQPYGQKLPATPWLWAYWPVMKVARAGQQRGNESIASANVVPCAGEQPPDVGHVRDVGGGLVVGHDDEDVRAPVLRRRGRAAPERDGSARRRERRERGQEMPDLRESCRTPVSSHRAAASVHRVSHGVNFCMLGRDDA